jgi:diadenosine tetraphosphate (Ap4A) HIT family hydrolase
MMPGDCPFCSYSDKACVASNKTMRAIRDAYPVAPGHTLIISRRHVTSYTGLNTEEKADLLALLDQVRSVLDAELAPEGYNVGFNDSAAAGQTVMHFHLHIIPRHKGDQADPRGGIRLIFPDRARYWGD